MELAKRKLIELDEKLKSLDFEFKKWRDASEEKNPLEKHHTQIRRITGQLDSLKEEIRKQLSPLLGQFRNQDNREEGASAETLEDLLAQCREIELTILEVHRIWEFFRSKLSLRSIDWFKNYLIAADEFAWACHEAAQKAAQKDGSQIPKEKFKEPPLVYFSGASTPLTMPRNWAYQAEHVADEEIQTDEFLNVLKTLPISIISLPWFQIRHISDALLIGHEVGHVVEDEFLLTETIEELITDATSNPRQQAWLSWASEIFADLYGCLATGPAYASALIDFLAIDRASITEEKKTAPYWGDYPTTYLRILVCLEALSKDFQQQSDTIRGIWESAYPSHNMDDGFEKDIPALVGALLKGPYPQFGSLTLFDVLKFSQEDNGRAEGEANNLVNGYNLKSKEVRVLFAAARLAFEKDPVGFADKNLQERVLNRVLQSQRLGTRSTSKRKNRQELIAMDEYDKAAGVGLLNLINKASARSNKG